MKTVEGFEKGKLPIAPGRDGMVRTALLEVVVEQKQLVRVCRVFFHRYPVSDGGLLDAEAYFLARSIYGLALHPLNVADPEAEEMKRPYLEQYTWDPSKRDIEMLQQVLGHAPEAAVPRRATAPARCRLH